MSRARDNANLGAQAGSGLDASDITTGVLPVGVTGGSGLNAVPVPADSNTIPHIIPDVLYPSYVASGTSNKLADGATDHSGAFGTAQADGRKYYYTNIAGSKPIKDPRIGAHFGSQRYKTTSLQLLEQETATHGSNVYSIDGREWCRFASHTAYVGNDSYGNYVSTSSTTSTDEFIEIVCFANGLNYLTDTWTQKRNFTWAINGGGATTNTEFVTTVATPLAGRYVGPFSVVNAFNGQTLGINTIRLNKVASHYLNIGAFELIAQDTTSTATKSQIQIPSQNVVSYGKKFTVSGTPHYDPFNGFTSGNLAAVQALIDTDTSLGLANWLHSGSYYRPYNGGRVVRWVDSSGVIKTSVNMMPPNAQNVGGTAITAKANASVANNTYLPTFSGAIDHSLAEVAKTFHYREFGNGAANAGASSSYADASMFTTGGDNIGYVMDDGLTSFSGEDVRENGQLYHHSTAGIYLTWIGTGLSYHSNTGHGAPNATWAQNLPYGTHILKIEEYAAYGGTNGEDHKLTLDGVVIANPLTVTHADTGVPYLGHPEFTFHQPKMPPIPEDAVVISDYMLMADFVKQTATGSNIYGQISKGSRLVGSTRDHFYNSSAAFHADSGKPRGDVIGLSVKNGSADATAKLPFFGTTGAFHVASSNLAWPCELGGSAATETKLDNTVSGIGDAVTIAETVTLGQTSIQTTIPSGEYIFVSTQVATPIHTSSHYQTFETPYLNELVGGDRNMEQTNLVVTPDGKTWDEVTRDTSYIGNIVLVERSSTNGWTFNDTNWKMEVQRGLFANLNCFVKNEYWVHAYDRYICLKAGEYEFEAPCLVRSTGGHRYIKINGVTTVGHHAPSGNMTSAIMCKGAFNRGDYVEIYDEIHGNEWSTLYIKKV